MSGNGTFVRICRGMVHLLENVRERYFFRKCQGMVHLLECWRTVRFLKYVKEQYMSEYVEERYICYNMSGNGTFVRICQGMVHLLEYVTSIHQHVAEQQDSYTKRRHINAQYKRWDQTSLIKLIHGNDIFVNVPMHKTPL